MDYNEMIAHVATLKRRAVKLAAENQTLKEKQALILKTLDDIYEKLQKEYDEYEDNDSFECGELIGRLNMLMNIIEYISQD